MGDTNTDRDHTGMLQTRCVLVLTIFLSFVVSHEHHTPIRPVMLEPSSRHLVTRHLFQPPALTSQGESQDSQKTRLPLFPLTHPTASYVCCLLALLSAAGHIIIRNSMTHLTEGENVRIPPSGQMEYIISYSVPINFQNAYLSVNILVQVKKGTGVGDVLLQIQHLRKTKAKPNNIQNSLFIFLKIYL